MYSKTLAHRSLFTDSTYGNPSAVFILFFRESPLKISYSYLRIRPDQRCTRTIDGPYSPASAPLRPGIFGWDRVA